VRFIEKGREPSALRKFKRRNRETPELLRYESIDRDTKDELRKTLLDEQGYLCAYTMRPIARTESPDFHVEHIRPQSENIANELDYSNLVLCFGRQGLAETEWGAFRKGGATVDERNFVSPLKRDCETRLTYGANGDIRATSSSDEAALGAIALLALNHRALRDARIAALRSRGLGPGASRPLTAAGAEREAERALERDNGGRLPAFCIAIKQVAERFARESRKRSARLARERGD